MRRDAMCTTRQHTADMLIAADIVTVPAYRQRVQTMADTVDVMDIMEEDKKWKGIISLPSYSP